MNERKFNLIHNFVLSVFCLLVFITLEFKIIFTDNTTFINDVLFQNVGDPGCPNIDRLY